MRLNVKALEEIVKKTVAVIENSRLSSDPTGLDFALFIR
jgi:hypothetical protein